MYRKILQYTGCSIWISKLIRLSWRSGNVADPRIFKINRSSPLLFITRFSERSSVLFFRKRLIYHSSWITLYSIRIYGWKQRQSNMKRKSLWTKLYNQSFNHEQNFSILSHQTPTKAHNESITGFAVQPFKYSCSGVIEPWVINY